ncbi:TerD family protein [Streptomyces sp. NPDC088197]|uniref:TerD family protein n=1 Tax=unclassified Streptomyces TaxID=2593676 RepID=UPI0033B51682
MSSSLNKGSGKIEVQLRWDPSPLGSPDTDLDLIAATFATDDRHGEPAYLVYFDSRSPDGTITLNRDSKTGKGFGADESMTIELDRLSASYGRVVVGVAIQQRDGRLTFGQAANPDIRLLEGYNALLEYDFADVADATAATVAEFTRGDAGEWRFHRNVRGYDADPAAFGRLMGGGAA